MAHSVIFHPSTIQVKVSLNAQEMTKDIDAVLTRKIKSIVGDKCYKQGYIKKESVRIIKRSLGSIVSSHFSGNLIYNVVAEVSICSLHVNDIVECQVIGKNKMGILARNGPLIVALSKLHHETVEEFEKVEKNDSIKVQVLCSKFELHDVEISVVGRMVV